MTAAVTLPRDLPESAWTSWVIDAATLHGWRVHHARPARTAGGWRTPVQGHAGAPDLLLAAELKTRTGRLRPEQRDWLAALGAHGCLWLPADAPQILARLARKATP